MSHWSLEIEIPHELSDWLSWTIAERLDVAVEIQDEDTLTPGPDDDLCRLIIRTESEPDATWADQIKDCLVEVGCREAPIRSKHVDDDSWMFGWRAFFKPTEVAPDVVVRPPWAEPSGALIDVIIDPGLAFGTGTHATTQLAAQLLTEQLRDQPKQSVLDQGCGSGILSLIAAQLGHDVIGVEIDPVAARNANENIPLNKMGNGSVKIISGDELPRGSFDLIVMNIIAPVLISLASQVNDRGPSTLLLSGLLIDQEASILKAYAGWEVIRRETQGEWVGMVLKKAAAQ